MNNTNIEIKRNYLIDGEIKESAVIQKLTLNMPVLGHSFSNDCSKSDVVSDTIENKYVDLFHGILKSFDIDSKSIDLPYLSFISYEINPNNTSEIISLNAQLYVDTEYSKNDDEEEITINHVMNISFGDQKNMSFSE